MGVEFLLSFLGRVYKRWGGRGLVLFAAGAVAGAFVALSTFGTYVYQFAIWRADEHLASANKRADRAEETSAAANKRASDAETALQELKTKYDAVNTQNQVYQKAEDLRKKNAAFQKQTAAKRPKSQILTDLFDEEDWFIIAHSGRKLVDRRHIIVATFSDRYCGGALGGPCGCTLTVTNVDTNEEDKFNFVEGRSGVLSIGGTKVTLILFSATNIGGRSEVCAFQQRQ